MVIIELAKEHIYSMTLEHSASSYSLIGHSQAGDHCSADPQVV